MKDHKTYVFQVAGMHCRSCVVMIESELREVAGVARARVDLAARTLAVTGVFHDDAERVRQMLSERIEKHGYVLSSEERKEEVRWNEFAAALPYALGFIGLFFLLQKMGIVNLVTASTVTYGTAFVVGIIASVSTCMAIVGGLALSLSANFTKEGERTRPQFFFHVGRIVSFFVLGGVIGAAGSMFRLGGTGTGTLNLLVGLVLLVLGLNLLDIFPALKRFQPTLPKGISAHLLTVRKTRHSVTPFLIGAATFFLPCGFTQSMQLYSLSTGSFMTGAFTMLAFSLGTLPILALLSFGSAGIRDAANKGTFFKAAGMVVIFFAVTTIYTSLVALGLISSSLNF